MAPTPRRSLQVIVSRWRQLAPAALRGDPDATVVADVAPTTTPARAPWPTGEDNHPALERRPTTRTVGINLSRWLGDAGRGLRLVRRLSQGGQAILFLAHQECVSRDVVVKIAPPHLRQDPPTLQWLHREATTLARLRHPGIPSVFDAGPGFILMTSIIGRTFEDALPAGSPATNLDRAVAVLEQVTEIVAYAHEQRVMHRDLKPANVLIDTQGAAWLVDWGLALDLRQDEDGQLRILPVAEHLLCSGTPAYLAPEAARADAGQLGAASDLFQLGAMLYRILTGVPPFAADDATGAVDRAAVNRWTPITNLNPEAPAQLVQAAQRAMDADPLHRGDITAFAEQLAAWRQSRSATRASDQLAATAATLLRGIRGANISHERLDEVVELCNQALRAAPGHPLAAQIRASALALGEQAPARPSTGFWSRLGRLLRPPRPAGG